MQKEEIVNSLDEESIIKPFEEWIRYQINDKAVPVFGLTITNREKTLYTKVHHHPDIKTPIPSIDRTLFNIGSVGKLFTYISLLQLVEQGKVSLNDPITKYMPSNFAPKNPIDCDPSEPPLYKQITVFNLIRHTSGIVREPPEGNGFNVVQCEIEELVQSICDSTLIYRPNTTFKYSNTAVAMVGYIIQKVSGILFEDYVQKYVLDPIGMTHCTFKKDLWNNTRYSNEDEMRLAVGHMWNYWDETTTDVKVFTEAPIIKLGMNPAGGLKCTLSEINHFLRVFLNGGGGLIGEKSFQLMMTPQPLSGPVSELHSDYHYHPSGMTHGLGVEINQLYGLLMAKHGGALYGFASEFRVLPEIGVGIYAVTTLDCTNSLVNQLTDVILQRIISHYFQPSPRVPYDVLALENAQLQMKSILKCQPIPKEIQNRVLGYYKMIDGIQEKDTHHYKIYQEYNQKIYRRTFLSINLSWISPENGSPILPEGALVTNDRISFGLPMKLKISNDGKNVAIYTYVRQNDISENNLFYQPYIPLPPVSKPPNDIQPFLKNLIGHYEANQLAVIYEDEGTMMICIETLFHCTLTLVSQRDGRLEFKFSPDSMYNDERVVFYLNSSGIPDRFELERIPFYYKHVGPIPGERQEGVCSPEESKIILDKSYSVTCPHKAPTSHSLVDLSTLSPTLLTDVKYATTDNFSGIAFYKVAKAYLHRQAAESLLRCHQWLAQWGVGLIIYDSYRPWNVTWAMAESVKPEFRGLYVADPNKGSVHNRGGAVDLTLYDLKTGEIIPMQGEYDEFSVRSHRSYFGGTSRQRWFKKLLTTAMMNHDFIPNKSEWWHFDYKISFDVLNIPLENL
ncbi:hypothetical protein PPL_10298 [Heterostelium album PN500]|uniref:Beta-lactamase-related domain-containing protein n=1 Tax=Heterostelium pallidum (strain ATCC 26659 / Pp 5 / PN500) TaxID=670386 RepID=D3BQW0_HETP5|nr:hypothetical protein PPL_10298 [Heterostelium album PN500]EFA76530.1 hypothetical protein PPL_10298 [Heterostelium album PN500]|eukprot:XP_020428662.1 hypothetical protein PPL_10298 [Heterostelium album PN500]